MLTVLFLLAGGTAGLFWALIHLLSPFEGKPRELALFLAAVGFSLIFMAVSAVPVEPLLSLAGIVLMLLVPSLPPVGRIYLKKILGRPVSKASEFLWIILPAVLCTGAVLLTSICGWDRAGGLFTLTAGDPGRGDSLFHLCYLWYHIVFKAVFAAETVIFLILLLASFRRDSQSLREAVVFFKGEKASTAVLQAVNISLILVLLVLAFFFPVALVAALLLPSLFFFGWCAIFCGIRQISASSMKEAFVFVEDPAADIVENGVVDEEIPEPVAVYDSPASHILRGSAMMWNDDSLLSRFERLIIKEQMFLLPSLTLTDVAKKLNSNKTYVSQLVNKTYNHPFPEFINILRVDYAEQYIVRHRTAKQKEIALACGFLSASSFNNIFKKVTGETPRSWLASYDKNRSAGRNN